LPEPDANANEQELRASPAQEPWHDKVLVDAISYTKGLVALLDSLSGGFQRRGRELEDQRTRLGILQNERRTILEERSAFDARITALTAERDGLRTALEERERELDKLRRDVARGQATRRRRRAKSKPFRSGIAEPTRQGGGTPGGGRFGGNRNELASCLRALPQRRRLGNRRHPARPAIFN
jgi:septal ring factor EnvC (AmiA/AmiB activator)